jgi:nicotinamidase/pyrazinamidase
MEPLHPEFRKGDGLLLVDVQQDFCAGGRLAVEGADEIVPLLNRWIEAAVLDGIPVYASRDWHPVRHLSFRDQGGQWPPHCLADSDGARFHPDLRLPESAVIITKGVRFDQDQNSVFDQTGFAHQLRHDGIKRLWVGGLALDVCVLASVMDGLAEGFVMKLIAGATRPVTVEGGRNALRRMEEAGAQIVSLRGSQDVPNP